MEITDLLGLLFIIPISLYPIYLAFRLYNLQGTKLYLLFIFYDGLGKAFFLINIFGRHLIDNVFSNNATPTHTQIIVGLLINFIAYPFLGLSTYFFVSFLIRLCDKKLPPIFKWPYLIWFSSGLVFFLVLIKEAIESKIQSWNIIGNDPGILMGNLIFYLFFYFGIFLLFRYSITISPKKKKNGIRYIGYYYFGIYSFIFLNILPGQRILFFNNTVLFIFIFTFNIPVAVYLKYYLSRLYEGPSIQSISEVQEYYASFKISKREAEIIAFVCQGKTNREISDLLFLSIQTIKNSLYNIYKKIGVKSRAGLINSLYKEKIN